METSYNRQNSDVAPAKDLNICGEDGASSSAESGLDIIASSRKGLDLSQYIDGQSLFCWRFCYIHQGTIIDIHPALTQSQTQSQKYSKKEEEEEAAEPENDGTLIAESTRTRQFPGAGRRHKKSSPEVVSGDNASEVSVSDWETQDPQAVYKESKARKALKRKRTAAETSRIRAQKKSRAAAASSIIGRKPPPRRLTVHGGSNGSSGGSDPEQDGGNETFLDDPIPEYILARQKHLRNGGFRLPPTYNGIDFSDSESEERPILHKNTKTQRDKKDIVLVQSSGIIPAPIAQWLREYQVEGAIALHANFVRQTGIILGDDMGLGKTIQVIAFLTAAFGKTATKRDAKRMRKVRRQGKDTFYPRVLIICPGSLMQNWEDELSTWGWWQAYRYHGNPATRREAFEAMSKGMAEILITTYDTYRLNESEINTIDWDCVVADEVHMVKNRNSEISKAMNKINALCRVGLTGTAVQNKYEELWTLLNWAQPGSHGSAQTWKQDVCWPLKMGQAHDASFDQIASAREKAEELVATILPRVFLRRMKTLIADQLPRKKDQVVFCPLTKTQADAYRAFLESDTCDFIRTAKEDCNCGSEKKRGWCCFKRLPDGEKWTSYMFPCLMALQKIANHLALIVPVTNDAPEKHTKDLEILQTACPGKWKDMYRDRDSLLNPINRQYCGKWKILKRLLDFWKVGDNKVLIFSHSVRLLRHLRALFDIDGSNYNFSYLDGGMGYTERSKAVADFNSNPDQFVFLISTKAGGVGLNITSANKVVVMDPNWNPAYDLQAQDRAYRIGQTRDVDVYRLVSAGTIEEIVYGRQIYKQQQASIVYKASKERRYFKGVMDSGKDGRNGELFGLENLFSFNEDGYLLRDVVHNTNVAEEKVGFKISDEYNVNTSFNEEDDNEGMKQLSNKNLGLTDDMGSSQLKKFVEATINGGEDLKSRKKEHTLDISAILAKGGVRYVHNNEEIIGSSHTEALIGKKALEVRHDTELGRRKVFHGSQSQSQGLDLVGAAYSGDDDDDKDYYNEIDDMKPVGSTSIVGMPEIRINYKYQPAEEIRKRQFCSMALMMGYDDPIQFALAVQGMTQEERRTVLDKMYRKRRRDLWNEFRGK